MCSSDLVVIFEGNDWQSLIWTANEPIGTLLNVTARSSSTDGLTWTAWESAVNGQILGLAPGGFLQIQVSFERPPNFASPVLYDLRVCKRMKSYSSNILFTRISCLAFSNIITGDPLRVGHG